MRTDRRARPGAYGAVVVVCLVLLALFTVAQVAHVHSVDSDADHCPLCVMLHTAAPVAVAAPAVVLVQIELTAPVLEERAITRNWHPQLFTRPPPIDSQASFPFAMA